MRTRALVLVLTTTSVAFAAESPQWATNDLRAGIIGTDTSHAPAFTGAFQSHPQWRVKVVAAFKGGSPDLPTSADRVEGFAKTLQDKYGVEIVGSIDELLTKVDVVLLESVDSQPRLAQATPVLKAGKRVKKQNKDIDKLRCVIELLVEREPLPPKYRDHKLTGYQGEHRDCLPNRHDIQWVRRPQR